MQQSHATVRGTEAAARQARAELAEAYARHPHAVIVSSRPGVGPVLGSRLISEFGDDPGRYPTAAARRRYAGTAPVTKASGQSRVVLMRRARSERLSDTCREWAFNAIGKSAGAEAYYRARRAAGDRHKSALRRLGSKLLGHCTTACRTWSPTTSTSPGPTP